MGKEMTTLILKTKDAKTAEQLISGLSPNVQFQAGDYPSPSSIVISDELEVDVVVDLLAEQGVGFTRSQQA